MTRRRLVQGAVAVGAITGAGLTAAPASAAEAGGTLNVVQRGASEYLSSDPLLHLLRRASYGPTPESIAEIRALGASAWVERQLNPGSIADGECDGMLARLPLAGLSIDAVRARVRAGALKAHSWEPMRELGLAAVARAVWSRRQLFEVMVDFWSNHLNVTCPSSDAWDNRADYDRNVIRRYAFGRFADLLKASARHPAMLCYLDNRSSTKARPNENYARELMELHTVGLGYREIDVRYAAYLLTGHTVDHRTGRYRYEPRFHYVGPVRVLGFSHANRTAAGGQYTSMALLDYLAMHPSTARRIAHKLCVRFVSDNPPDSLVSHLAWVYRANRTAIAPVLRALFSSAEFGAAVGQKVRTPLEDIVATVRTLGLRPEPAGVEGLRSLFWTVDAGGHAPMGWAPPNGYPDVAAAWASPAGYLNRWNSHLNIAAGWYPDELVGAKTLRPDLLPTLPGTYGALIDTLAVRLLGRTLHPEHTAAVATFFGKTPASTLRAKDSALSWKFPYLVALLLDSPYFSIR